jgi:hypothetical protein
MPDLLEDDDTETFAAPDTGEDDRFREMRRTANKAAKLSKENSALTERLAQMERKVAFADAGLDLTDKQKTALLAAHDGELTRDALRVTAAELKFIEADEPDGDSALRETAMATQAKIATASSGSRPPAKAPTTDEQIRQIETSLPRDATIAEKEAAWNEAGRLKALEVSKLARRLNGM